MSAASYKFAVDQGATWRVGLTIRDEDASSLDLTGYSARMHVRESLDSLVPLLILTSEPGGGITLNGPAGQLTLRLTDEQTAALPWRYGLYDLELESPDGDVTRILAGEITVSREVTR